MDVFSYCEPVVAKEKIPHFASGFPILKEQPRDEVEQLKYIVLQNAFFFAFLQHMTYFRSTLPHGEKLWGIWYAKYKISYHCNTS